MRRNHVIAAAHGLLIILALAIAALDAFAEPLRQRLGRVGDIAFGTTYEDAKIGSEALDGLAYITGDRRVLKTLTQHKTTVFDTTFNLTYVFGQDDRLTRVFGSHPNMLTLDRNACAAHSADLFAASVRQYGSPDLDKSERDSREWRFNFADGRWIKLKFVFGGILDKCSITLDSTTPDGQSDRP
jgi:hypothetical protein